MKSLLITPLFLFLSLFSCGQPVEKTLGNRVMTVDELEKIMLVIEPKVKTFSIDSFNLYFEKNLNEYRVSKNQNTVSYDKSILNVSTEQSSYCLKNGYLSHKQPTSSKEDVDERCDLYDIDYVAVHENLMMGHMIYPVLILYEDGMNYYDCLSLVTLKCWMLSPGHNSTLLTNGQTFAVGISYDKENTMVACFVLIDN
jgi:uncharacterized protein YkwD